MFEALGQEVDVTDIVRMSNNFRKQIEDINRIQSINEVRYQAIEQIRSAFIIEQIKQDLTDNPDMALSIHKFNHAKTTYANATQGLIEARVIARVNGLTEQGLINGIKKVREQICEEAMFNIYQSINNSPKSVELLKQVDVIKSVADKFNLSGDNIQQSAMKKAMFDHHQFQQPKDELVADIMAIKQNKQSNDHDLVSDNTPVTPSDNLEKSHKKHNDITIESTFSF
jgi:hypothetical protein